MKKLFISALVVCSSVMFANAQNMTNQTKPAAKTETQSTSTKTDSKTAKTATKADGTKTSSKSTTSKSSAKTTQHLKKDGTPDKRYKENKDAAPAKK